MTPVAGSIVATRFRLVRPLGQGSMGSVWLAEHLGLEIPCALKLIHAEDKDSAESRARFEREAKSAAQIRSVHVVQILDHGVWEGTPYIAMELLEGEDLDDRLRHVGRLSPRETAAIVAQVARALSKAHSTGLVHRDLKPANIFLARDDDREIVKVLDFGIAKDTSLRAGAGATKTGAVLGTPAYMSPEQAQGIKAIDHRSDLWSLAVVAFECMTGTLPFVSQALGDLLLKIMVEPPPVPSRIAPVPAGFDAWWARAIARDPNARFQSAKELSDALILALGISTGDAADLQSSSDIFTLSSLGLTPSQLSRPLAPLSDEPSTPAASEGRANAQYPPASTEASAAAPGAPRSPRSGPHTPGPVSTHLAPRSAAGRGGRGRIALSVLAGALVAGIGAALLLGSLRPTPDEPAAPEPAPSAAADPGPGAAPAAPAVPEPSAAPEPQSAPPEPSAASGGAAVAPAASTSVAPVRAAPRAGPRTTATGGGRKRPAEPPNPFGI